MEKKNIIFDTDIGDDDAVALTALMLAKNINILAITTTWGNLPIDRTTDNALRLVEYMGKDIPVYRGCHQALVRKLTPGRNANTLQETVKKVVDGKEVTIHFPILPIKETTRKLEDKHAVSYLVETLKNAKEKIDVCAVGPLTNIAMAISMEPDIVKNIGTLYIMGGGCYIGNRTPIAEANWYDDPEAAEIVCTSGANILICPIEACEKGATFNQDDLAQIKQANNYVSKFLYDVIGGYTERAKILFGDDSGECCVYDYAAISPLLDESVVLDEKHQIVHCDCGGGMADGQMVVDRRSFSPFEKTAHVIYDIDSNKVHRILIDLAKNA